MNSESLLMNIPAVPEVAKKNKVNPLSFLALPFCLGVLALGTPAHAATTITTDPTQIMGTFETAEAKLDDVSGLAAAVGMSTVIFGGAALTIKRFLYA